MKIQWGDPIVVATIRGLYTAVGMGAFMWLTVYSTTDDAGAAWVAFGFAFLGALGFRAGVEGTIDQRRKEASANPVAAPAGFDEPAGWPTLSGAIAPGNVIHSGASNAVTIENLTDRAISVTDFDSDYHFTDDGRHMGKSVDCKLCNS